MWLKKNGVSNKFGSKIFFFIPKKILVPKKIRFQKMFSPKISQVRLVWFGRVVGIS